MCKRWLIIGLVGCITLSVSACWSKPSTNQVQTIMALTATPAPQESPTFVVEPLPATPKPLASCSEEEVDSYLSDLGNLLEEFDDTAKIAGSTSRLGLAPVIQGMQTQKRNARRLDRPECANYLQDLVTVAVETKIDAFISFLSQDSDTVVARKLDASDEVRSMVDGEIEAFRLDPLAAYESSKLTAESVVKNVEQNQPFVLPNGWRNVDVPDSDELILSIPENWTATSLGDNRKILQLHNDDETLSVVADMSEQNVYSEFDSDRARLFVFQTAFETQGWDFYLEHSAEAGVYALNRGYVVNFSRRYVKGSDIEKKIWGVIITPHNQEVHVVASTKRDDFAQIDLLTLQEIYGSIRSNE